MSLYDEVREMGPLQVYGKGDDLYSEIAVHWHENGKHAHVYHVTGFDYGGWLEDLGQWNAAVVEDILRSVGNVYDAKRRFEDKQ